MSRRPCSVRLSDQIMTQSYASTEGTNAELLWYIKREQGSEMVFLQKTQTKVSRSHLNHGECRCHKTQWTNLIFTLVSIAKQVCQVFGVWQLKRQQINQEAASRCVCSFLDFNTFVTVISAFPWSPLIKRSASGPTSHWSQSSQSTPT